MNLINKLKSVRYFFRNIYRGYPYRHYFNKHECIFIHIPKAAGTSVLKTLSNNKRIYHDHYEWSFYNKFNRVKFKNYFKFTIVRNPFDRVVSIYSYLKGGGDQKGDLYFSELFKSQNITFDKFVLEYLDEYKIHEHILFKPQYLFVFDDKYNLKVDFVARLENIDKDFLYIKSKIGRQDNYLQKTNTSVRKDNFQEYYQKQELVDKILGLYKKDFELLKYDTGINTIEKS